MIKLVFLIKKCEISFRGLANFSDLPYVRLRGSECLLNSKY